MWTARRSQKSASVLWKGSVFWGKQYYILWFLVETYYMVRMIELHVCPKTSKCPWNKAFSIVVNGSLENMLAMKTYAFWSFRQQSHINTNYGNIYHFCQNALTVQLINWYNAFWHLICILPQYVPLAVNYYAVVSSYRAETWTRSAVFPSGAYFRASAG